MDIDWTTAESQQHADYARDLRSQLDAAQLGVQHTQQAYLNMAETADIWMQTANYNQRLFEQAQAARQAAEAERDQLREQLERERELRHAAEMDGPNERAERAMLAALNERDALQLQLDAMRPDDLIDIVEATWGDNATVLAYLVGEPINEATLLLRGVGDWQMYERDETGYWELTGEGTGVNYASIRLTKAGAEQLDRWHTEDMLPEPCAWHEDSNGIWNTTCDDAWEMGEGTPAASGYQHCPKCGKVIEAHAYVEPEPEPNDEEEVQP